MGKCCQDEWPLVSIVPIFNHLLHLARLCFTIESVGHIFVQVKNSFGKIQKLFFCLSPSSPLFPKITFNILYDYTVIYLSRFIKVYRGLPCIIIDDRPQESLSNGVLYALFEAKLCQMRDSNPRSLMRNKTWACRLRPLGQSDFNCTVYSTPSQFT